MNQLHLELFAVKPTGPVAWPLPPKATSIHELFDSLPIGVYTAFSSFNHNQFLRLQDHLDRLENSIAWMGWDYKLDRLTLRQALHQVCSAYPLPDCRIRIDVLAAPVSYSGVESRLVIALSPFQAVPEQYYLTGVDVGVASRLSRDQPRVKKAEFVLRRRKYLESDPSMYEFLLLDEEGRILEGATSNFYAVKDGFIWTAGKDMLEGIARKLVLEVAADLAIPVRMEPVNQREIDRLDEAALSSSSRGIIPIVNIAGRPVGSGYPGPVIQKLSKAYNAFVSEAIRPAI